MKAAHFHLLYTGDTGYSRDFFDIRQRLGDVDVALIPIGAYEPRWFMKKHHVNPEDALQIHHDLRSKRTIGIHWGTFRLSDEAMAAPPEELTATRVRVGITENEFGVMKHGETLTFLK